MNYTVLHLHSDFSNAIFIDSTTKYKEYIDRAKAEGMKAIAFTEHGGVFSWVAKKQYCDEVGIKYIHGIEMYVTKTLNEKIKDNYHVCLYAKNWDGVKEINKLSSISFHRNDNHFYYEPRISIDELINTSDNIIVTTACIGGILASDDEEIKNKFISFLVENKHRCFLEIQHHIDSAQIQYNQYLYELHQKYKIPLIVGTDTHSLDLQHAETRKILQKSKKISYNEDNFDLIWKTYDELIEIYKKQNSLPLKVVEEAIENTNIVADMVEDFTLDATPKYPKIYENSEEVFKQKINEGWIRRGINKLPPDLKRKYKERVQYEFEVYKQNNAIDYMLLLTKLVDYYHEHNIQIGYGRGSVNGSLIAYLLGITEIDSIKWDLNFERFMHNERVSMPDVDLDHPPSKRDEVKKYLFNGLGLNCADIIVYNTLALKGAIRDVGRALEIPIKTVNEICDNVETDIEQYKQKFPQLFNYAEQLQGVIVSIGNHPCGSVVADKDLAEYMGLCSTSTDEYMITQINMKEIDSLNYVKLDLLALDNIQIINETCELAGIPRITPDTLDINDIKVWDSIKESNIGIFQWESDFAHEFYKKLFSKETLDKIKAIQGDKFSYINLFTMGNGALRPAGESYREKMAMGEFHDNKHEALNEFLKDTLGFLVYQEQLIRFLNKFCGFSMGKADVVRKAFSKKLGTEQYIPEIKEGFIKTMTTEYGLSQEKAEEIIVDFLKVIEDAGDYLFNQNHALPYSFIGYACAWLRYYYSLEFLTTMLNVHVNDIEKTAKIIEYGKQRGIKFYPIQFRYSKGTYNFNREQNAIYKGLGSIKYLNIEIGDQLYELRDKQYNTFVDLLLDIENSNIKINSRQMEILIKLNFFKEFGSNRKLLRIYEEFKKQYKPTLKESTKQKRLEHLYRFEANEIDDCLNPKEQLIAEYEYLGYCESKYPYPKTIFVYDIDTKCTPKLYCYSLSKGTTNIFRVAVDIFKKHPIEKYDIIQVADYEVKPAKRPNEKGEWVLIPNTKEFWLTKYKKLDLTK